MVTGDHQSATIRRQPRGVVERLLNARRFDDALAEAREGNIRVSPFLVGIESFSQPELDRYNKGTTAAANIEFIERLWGWRERYGETLRAAVEAGTVALGIDGVALVQEAAPLRGGHITRVETLNGEYLYAIDVYPAQGSFDLCPADACQRTDGVELVRAAFPTALSARPAALAASPPAAVARLAAVFASLPAPAAALRRRVAAAFLAASER